MKKSNLLENCKYYSEADMKKKGVEKCRKIEQVISFSYSNAKLKDTKNVGFIQWNIPAVETCPFRTEKCEESCYAKKCERYDSCRIRRKMHFEASKMENFVEIMVEQIEYELKRRKFKNKVIYFRIHESGDFYNYEYLEKWYQITSHFVGKNIIFEAYTKSLPYFDKLYKKYGRENVNIKVLSSIWDDTSEKMVELTKEMGLHVYTAIEAEKIDKFLQENTSFQKCECEDCGKCGKCYVENCSLIVAIH